MVILPILGYHSITQLPPGKHEQLRHAHPKKVGALRTKDRIGLDAGVLLAELKEPSGDHDIPS